MNAYADANKFGKEGVDNALRSLSAMTKGFQQIASETTEFTKKSYEQSTQLFEQMSQVRTLDKALEVQGDYARSAYEAWIAQASKVGEIYSEIAREAYRPLEGSVFSFNRFVPGSSQQTP
ncbi:phasin family protein [Aureimonas sp. ME7]|uniref:phasin family protein n=1 Tax=Aureimonas sp. ME7 TaxID=2744252 RepID=UPI0015F6EF5E|nr:phasin family protein [Aureimonas sp. ME7]